MKQSPNFIFLFFLLLTLNSFSQSLNEDGTIDCTTPTEIAITSDTIIMMSSGDYTLYESSVDPIIFYKETDKYTFWYKLIIQDDCELTFNIFPTNSNDIYNFFLYRYPGGNFCQGIINKSILPIRANLYKDKINKSGTGLSLTPENGNAVTSQDNLHILFYRTSHHESINAKAGEIYYLNVYHTSGDDCGHFLYLKACADSAKIQATHRPCFIPTDNEEETKQPPSNSKPLSDSPKREERAMQNATAQDNPAPAEKKRADVEILAAIRQPDTIHKKDNPHTLSSVPLQNREESEGTSHLSQNDIPEVKPPEYYTITGFTKESKKDNPLDAAIKIVEEATLEEVAVDISPNTGRYTAKLKKHKNYKLIFSALGYIRDSLTIEYNQIDKTKLLQIDIKLESVHPGDNFVLNNIYFHPNTYAFRRESRAEFEALFNFMKINDHVIIEIQGHTNGDYFIKKDKHFSHLSEEWNFQGTSKKLSKYRAETVKKYLTGNGISEDRVKTLGFGGEKMIIANPKNYTESLKNMRVEIRVLKI